MKTTHRVLRGDARDLSPLPDGSVHLVVTSPPYPMVEMWDATFGIDPQRGMEAFEAMHVQLDAVWAECRRVVVAGGFVCVNIGDATRTVGGVFHLFPNAARIKMALVRLGFVPLPDILWRKPTNAPNKFMGSGMLPGGAYVTYEHEYVLVFRASGKRDFPGRVRAESAYLWEERNTWFSDLWELPGARQDQGGRRSGAFPFELPYRLVHMYSVRGGLVLDPFVGTGTTCLAAIGGARNSVGWDLEPHVTLSIEPGRSRTIERLRAHAAFAAGREMKHKSDVYGFGVVTSQEREIQVWVPDFQIGEETVHSMLTGW